jgi:Ca2+-binding RTX toxin-like protein
MSTLSDVTIGEFAQVTASGGLNFTTAATAVVGSVDITIGSGSTAVLGVLETAAADGGSGIDKLTFTLAGSGNVNIVVSSGFDRGSAVIDGIQLGGALTLNASAVTGIAFNIDLGGSKAASGSVISLGAIADTVYGGASADTIEGGGGNDELAGRGGADTFVYLSNEAAASVDGIDVITDMGTADVISLAAITGLNWITAISGGVDGFTAIAGAFSAKSAGDFAVFKRGSDVIVQVVLSSGTTALSAGRALEIVLQGETLNTSFTVNTGTDDAAHTLTNLVIS